MRSDFELYEETGKLVAENYGRKPEVQQHRESQEETSPLDGPLCIVIAVLLGLVFLGLVACYFSM